VLVDKDNDQRRLKVATEISVLLKQLTRIAYARLCHHRGEWLAGAKAATKRFAAELASHPALPAAPLSGQRLTRAVAAAVQTQVPQGV
jgi:hypothetical protein